jgi:hypothetical protein
VRRWFGFEDGLGCRGLGEAFSSITLNVCRWGTDGTDAGRGLEVVRQQGNITRVRWDPLLRIPHAGTPPSGRVGHTITAVGSRLLVLGGREYATNSFDSTLHSFNVHSSCWSQVPLEALIHAPSPLVRTGHCTTVHAGRLLLFGGLRDDGVFLDDISAVVLMR